MFAFNGTAVSSGPIIKSYCSGRGTIQTGAFLTDISFASTVLYHLAAQPLLVNDKFHFVSTTLIIFHSDHLIWTIWTADG